MKTIMDMALESGFSEWAVKTPQDLERFAELVRADEREACAKVCDDNADIEHWQDKTSGGIRTGLHAKAIRARGNT